MIFIRTFIIPLIVLLTLTDMVFFRFLMHLSHGMNMKIYFWILILAIEFYSYQAFRTLHQSSRGLAIYIAFHLLLYGTLIYFQISTSSGFSSSNFKKTIILLSLVIVPKIFLAIALVLEDLFRIGLYLTQQLQSNSVEKNISGRRKAISWLAIGIASIPFLGVLHGIFIGKYNYHIIRKKIKIKNLPSEFEGFKITQISDFHAGSFDNLKKVEYGIDLITETNPDVLVFTGDMVNNYYKEVEPILPILKKLNAKEGMFSVLGNHDYGDYGKLTEAEKKESIQGLQNFQREMGFLPLNNEMKSIEKNGKKLNIIGVENWGNADYFPKKGDLKKATQAVQEDDINILLSHDPSHFDHDLPGHDNVIQFEKMLHLTLSGHTHGMQFGIEIPGLIRWSPVKYRYHNWAGWYEKNGRQLYVNRGFGYLAFPGRVGIWPEITVLELTKA
ncbi:Uncharacterized metallophosphoesterase Cj0846 [Candidatus Ornithobacterium hominis]|uniref:metallophosphoesterase n=1 Tax=Candidatus Ornithobacterium hominis TaxID=2497989 RepID=UPI000E854E32|nr:metallophosphoesterase [Candidatus Ornithobacterium hominis]SZD72171.1 Uncharacterized metallophosphoesterase Cj0846 [Candidatus Ornithobacterium hominis]